MVESTHQRRGRRSVSRLRRSPRSARRAGSPPRDSAPPADASRKAKAFSWMDRHIGKLCLVVVVGAVALGMASPTIRDDEEVDFDPGGPIYDTADRSLELFDPASDVESASFLVEHPRGGDVLTKESLLIWLEREEALRADDRVVQGQPVADRLARGADLDLGIEVDGIYSLADALDEALPDGLAGATDAQVKLALAETLADGAPTSGLRATLSQRATNELGDIDGRRVPIWTAPAFTAPLRYDLSSFAGDTREGQFANAELWLREAQTTLRGGQVRARDDGELTVYGISIDFDTTFEESFQAGGPFIFLAVALIVLLVGALLRSYWAGAVVASGLGVTMLFYNGLIALLGLEQSPLLQLIVPIAMIAFGVDFFIHAAGRMREEQLAGRPRRRASVLGLTAVFGAILLAGLTSAAAFLSNAVSGIEAITEFGVGAAVALGLAFVILGVVAPTALLALEDRLGGRPGNLGMMIPHKVGFVVACVVAGVTVSLTVVMPVIGVGALLAFLGLFVGVPYALTRRRNRRWVDAGRPLVDEVKGAGHGFAFAGTVVHFLARWRVITLPVVLGLAIAGVIGAVRVDSAFEVKDLLPRTTDTVVSLDKADEHFGGRVGGPGYVLVEGDLTDPATLVALEQALESVTDSGAELTRAFDGSVQTSPNAASIVRTAVASAPALEQIAGASGVTVTDEDGDGLPDTAEQVAAIYTHAVDQGVPDASGALILRPDMVQRFLHVDGDTQATRLEVLIPTITDDVIIREAWDALDLAAADLEQRLGDTAAVGVSGEPITTKAMLDAFVRSMLMSLPLAVLLAALIAGLVMRSVRYGLISVVPPLLVVGWVYAFMWLVDLKVNLVTATIAAISIGVGIDYATHFTMRFREEFEDEPSRFPALRRAGEGTGGALALSALTSIIGFVALSLAPTPTLAIFGMLTAVMIAFSLLVSLLVLPSLLLLVTPSRRGEEREAMERQITQGRFVYEPHARSTSRPQPTAQPEPTGRPEPTAPV